MYIACGLWSLDHQGFTTVVFKPPWSKSPHILFLNPSSLITPPLPLSTHTTCRSRAINPRSHVENPETTLNILLLDVMTLESLVDHSKSVGMYGANPYNLQVPFGFQGFFGIHSLVETNSVDCFRLP